MDPSGERDPQFHPQTETNQPNPNTAIAEHAPQPTTVDGEVTHRESVRLPQARRTRSRRQFCLITTLAVANIVVAGTALGVTARGIVDRLQAPSDQARAQAAENPKPEEKVEIVQTTTPPPAETSPVAQSQPSNEEKTSWWRNLFSPNHDTKSTRDPGGNATENLSELLDKQRQQNR